MTAEKFLTVLGASLGFVSAIYFAVGMLRMSAEDIWRGVRTHWDMNLHQVNSVCAQRADYVVGAIFLLLAFSSQLLANVIPPALEPSFLQPIGCAVALMLGGMALLVVGATIVRRVVLSSTLTNVLSMQAEAERRERQEIEVRKKS